LPDQNSPKKEVRIKKMIINKNKLLRSVASLSIGAFLSAPVLPSFAAEQSTQAAPTAQTQRAGMHDAMKQAINSLNLSDDQKSQLSSIFADAKSKREALRADNSLSQDQKHDKMKAIHADTRAKINQVLTADQRTQLKEKLQAARSSNQQQSTTPQQ
jgi:periplasmic protein CpxP/Spy